MLTPPPQNTKDRRNQKCLTNCIAEKQEHPSQGCMCRSYSTHVCERITTACRWETCPGLQVFLCSDMYSHVPVGLRAPVHWVLRRPSANPLHEWEYKDCTPADDETEIFFVPIPDMFTSAQGNVVDARPMDMRMGVVLVDFPNASKMPGEPSYTQQCMKYNPFDRATAVTRVRDLVHYIVDTEEGKVMTLERDGTAVECPV